MSCNCALCNQGKAFTKILEKNSEEDKKYLESLYNHFMEVESDFEYMEKLYIPKLIKKLEGLREVIKRKDKSLSFFMSAVRGGEAWSDECDRMKEEAFKDEEL